MDLIGPNMLYSQMTMCSRTMYVYVACRPRLSFCFPPTVKSKHPLGRESNAANSRPIGNNTTSPSEPERGRKCVCVDYNRQPAVCRNCGLSTC
jgi:hypothetical protein